MIFHEPETGADDQLHAALFKATVDGQNGFLITMGLYDKSFEFLIFFCVEVTYENKHYSAFYSSFFVILYN